MEHGTRCMEPTGNGVGCETHLYADYIWVRESPPLIAVAIKDKSIQRAEELKRGLNICQLNTSTHARTHKYIQRKQPRLQLSSIQNTLKSKFHVSFFSSLICQGEQTKTKYD